MTIDTSEKDFEATIEQHLLENGYTSRKPDEYNRSLCLDQDILFDFIFATQPRTWEKLKVQHGTEVKERFLRRLIKQIESRGTLDVLRKGITDLGCKFELAYFKPETTLNEEHRRLYNANILSVMRQARYSEKNENSIDLALFINGLPIITAELKNPLKGQTVEHAIKQYRFDRDPREPLLKFGRCLAHFAIDTDLVYMTTDLRGTATKFLPFNKGCDNGAGNPVNPHGFKTAYLWEKIWERDSLFEIINQFLEVVEEEDDRGKKTGKKKSIFPRFHQLDAVKRLIGHAKSSGPGQNYLVEHSAGSGKSNSIAWLSHRLAGLHDAKDKRIFDSIIVVTDRRVLDRQLRRTIRSFEHVKGVVTTVVKHKSKELAEALKHGRDIIVTTLQTFPFLTDKISTIPGKRFAVVIDEAHSSQSGETHRSLKEVLSLPSLEEAEKIDRVELPTDEDTINQAIEDSMKRRGQTAQCKLLRLYSDTKGQDP